MTLDPRASHVFEQLTAHLMEVAATVAKYHLELVRLGLDEESAATLTRDVQRRLLGEVERAVEDSDTR